MLRETFPDALTILEQPSAEVPGVFTIKILPQLPDTCEQYFCSCLVRGEYRPDTDQIDYSIVEEETDGLSAEQIAELD